MDTDEIYKFIGYAVAVIFFIYIISKALSINVRVIEGLTSQNDTSKTDLVNQDNILDEIKLLQKTEDSLKTSFNIDKSTKDNYSTLLDNLYTVMNYRLLKLIIENSEKINSKPDDPATIASIKKINEMKEFIDTLSFYYKTLDTLSSNSNSLN